ncbi:ketopantoate reductase family protein [Oceanisphaera psychrotolerans]|uniref:2-dehydropantoate 2-reductase n=1 Tax=Oceanisphaera psychrotolerans TaxID=1414654 RepID=A0A1J4QK13_9GAMM|nr:2-dehydropantoate 2-reductase [Oceanisphaera psychrotolerans]OIN13785.1 2-dehydropantoate 2-reductase [Oceanisphaera psychrotolerans]
MTEWTILGAGALGCVMAGLLRQRGERVALMLSERHRSHFHPSLDMITLGGRHQLIQTQPRFAEQARQAECLLVFTKAYQVVDALTGLQQLPTTAPIVLLHNGLGAAEQVQELFPHNPLIAGVSSHGAMKEGDWLVRHTGKGETWLGPLNEAAHAWAHLVKPLSAALGHAEWSEDIRLHQHRKLSINAVINPLTACHNIRNGQLLEPRYADVLEQLSEEVFQVMANLGETESQDAFRRRLQQVIELTATNYSSMHQDLVHGRKTENDYITGYILAHAGTQPVPVSSQLYREIKRRGG